jgi:hypothetical protein
MHTTRTNTIVSILATILLAGAAEGQLPFPDIAGAEKWVDGPTAVQPGNTPDYSAVAVDEEGRRIHVWGANVGGANGREVFLRRFNAAGAPLGNSASPAGDPVQVNTTTAELQDNPRVAVSSDGSFLVVFDSREEFGGLLRRVVRSRAYGANGDPLGPEQLVSPQQTGTVNPSFVDVAALRVSDGSPNGYVVVWITHDSVGTDTNRSVQGCLIGSNGVPGAEFQINSDDPPNQDWSSVTELPDGGFLAIWTTANQVWGRRFNGAGGPIGNDFQISTTATTQAVEKDAAIGWGGRVAIVWSGAEGVDLREIRMRLYDGDLVPLGADFRVNTVTTGFQTYPRVADYGPEGFLVVWESEVASGVDPGDSIEARLVTGVDDFAGPQAQYNVWDDDDIQQYPATHGWYGRLATTWDSPTWDDPSLVGYIVGRDIEHCLFCDDFEWGSTWRWSGSIP